MSDALRVLYYQLTLGPAHMARVRALDAVSGFECVGVELASSERTRNYELTDTDRLKVETVMTGVYEEVPFVQRLCCAKRHLAASRADAIIIDSPADPVQWLLASAARRQGVAALTRWAATIHDHPRKIWKEILKRGVYRGWDHYLVTGQRGLDYLGSFGVERSKATLCGNPVESGPIEAARRSCSVSREPRFLFVGRFLALKNLDRFLAAFLRYRSGGGLWGLDIVGTGEPVDVHRLKELVAGESCVRFRGHLQFEALIDAYSRAGCLVLPSYSENWGLVVNEAMHAGMPVLLSDRCGCHPDLLRVGENGFDFDPCDEPSMVEALRKMESASEDERVAFGERSVELIAPHTPERWAERVAEIVRGLRA